MKDYMKEKRLMIYIEYVGCKSCIPPSEMFRVELSSYLVDKTYIKSQLTQFKLVQEEQRRLLDITEIDMCKFKNKKFESWSEIEVQTSHEKIKLDIFGETNNHRFGN